jgi:hypothetical protein
MDAHNNVNDVLKPTQTVTTTYHVAVDCITTENIGMIAIIAFMNSCMDPVTIAAITDTMITLK